MDLLEKFTKDSVELYEFLEKVPTEDERDEIIHQINQMVDERCRVALSLKDQNINPFKEGPISELLIELDKGIIERLKLIQQSIISDIKHIQDSKKGEMKYIDPYSGINLNQGIYYDRKK